MNSPLLSPLSALAQCVLPLKDELAPASSFAGRSRGRRDKITVITANAVAADDLAKDLHPALLVGGSVGIKVDYLAVVEPDAEPFLDEHIALFLFGKGRPSALAALAHCLLLRQRAAVVDQSLGVGEVDGGAGLACRLVVGCELGADQLEVTTTPVLGVKCQYQD